MSDLRNANQYLDAFYEECPHLYGTYVQITTEDARPIIVVS